jgi:arylformamidase
VSPLQVRIAGRTFRADSARYIDLSIPVSFQDEGPSAFGVPPASVRTVETERFIGDTRRGGSCNVREYRITPHCHGAHTECVGHIVDQEISVTEMVRDAFIPATLISVMLEKAGDCSESYVSGKEEGDLLITRRRLIEELERLDNEDFRQALIIRTLPNSSAKKKRRYASAPYFSNEAMAEIVRRKINHLLVDTPSVDRMDDQGRLSNHRLFWEAPPGSRDLGQARAPHRTITELIFVPDEAHDGYYLLNLQIAPLSGDAAPCRPLIFPVEVS